MSKINRYSVGFDGVDPNGNFVKHSDYEELQRKVEALAVEGATLKHAMSVTLEHVSVMDTGQAGVAAMIINDALHNSKTPTTDVVMAEILAQGVDMFAKKCTEKAKQSISSDTRDNWWLCGEHADDFSQQIRREAGQ